MFIFFSNAFDNLLSQRAINPLKSNFDGTTEQTSRRLASKLNWNLLYIILKQAVPLLIRTARHVRVSLIPNGWFLEKEKKQEEEEEAYYATNYQARYYVN